MTCSKINPARARAAGGCKNYYIIFAGTPQMRNRGNFGHKRQKRKELFGQTVEMQAVAGTFPLPWTAKRGKGERGPSLPWERFPPTPLLDTHPLVLSARQGQKGGDRRLNAPPIDKKRAPGRGSRARALSFSYRAPSVGSLTARMGKSNSTRGREKGDVRRGRRRSFSWRGTSGRRSWQ